MAVDPHAKQFVGGGSAGGRKKQPKKKAGAAAASADLWVAVSADRSVGSLAGRLGDWSAESAVVSAVVSAARLVEQQRSSRWSSRR